jgi:hypothetical protein
VGLVKQSVEWMGDEKVDWMVVKKGYHWVVWWV